MAVVTSRDRLTGLVALDGAIRVPMDVLTAQEASDLLGAILGRARVAAEREAVHALAELCGRLPLALRIAAAAPADEQASTLADHVSRLSATNLLPQLTIDGDPAASMRAAFSTSYLRLSGDAQRMFRLLGVAPGVDTPHAAAAALAGCPDDGAKAQLEELCAAHLLDEHTDGRYRLHDLIREYAREMTRQTDSEDQIGETLDRILAWYVAQAYNADRFLQHQPAVPEWVDTAIAVPPIDDVSAALAWFEREGPNVLDAVRRAETVRPARCWHLAIGLFGWLERQSMSERRIETYTIGARAARAADDASGEAIMLSALAITYCRLNREIDALPHFERCLEIRRRPGMAPRHLGIALMNLGAALTELDRPDEAIVHLEEALAIGEQEPTLHNKVASILNNLGGVYARTDTPEAAVPYFRRSLDLAIRDGDPAEIASMASNFAMTLTDLAHYDDATAMLDLAVTNAKAAQHRRFEAAAYAQYGIVMLRRGDVGQARSYLDLAVDTNHDEAFADIAIANLRDELTVAQAR